MVAIARVGPHEHHPHISNHALAATTGYLPVGFAYLLDGCGNIITAVLLFLRAKSAFSGVLRSEWTNSTYAEHLYEWFSLLEAISIQWDAITEQDLVAYSTSLASHVSSHTKTELSPRTRKSRLRTILAFYRFAFQWKFIPEAVTLDESRILRLPDSRLDLAHIRKKPTTVTQSEILDDVDVNRSDPPSCIDEASLSKIFSALVISEDSASVANSPRDRLIADIGLNGGLRLSEVANLTVRQILSLVPNPEQPNSPCALWLGKTKGSVPRTVFLPSWLVAELHAYIDNERRLVVNMAMSARPLTYVEPTKLFLSLVTATKRDIGKPVTRATIMRRFRQAVERCLLTKTVPALDPVTGNRFLKTEVRYTFHSLRHTFAYTAYYAFYRNGDAFPWRKVQTLLGHKFLTTTLDIYLQGAETAEIEVSDAVVETFSAWRELVRNAA